LAQCGALLIFSQLMSWKESREHVICLSPHIFRDSEPVQHPSCASAAQQIGLAPPPQPNPPPLPPTLHPRSSSVHSCPFL
jgi:hypothetical protein